MIDRLEREHRVLRVTDPADRRRVIVERVPGTLSDVDEIVAPARREVAAVFARYTPEQQEILFGFFAQAAPAFRAATEQLRARAAQHRRRGVGEPVRTTAKPVPTAIPGGSSGLGDADQGVDVVRGDQQARFAP
jgi:hypothetical protein